MGVVAFKQNLSHKNVQQAALLERYRELYLCRLARKVAENSVVEARYEIAVCMQHINQLLERSYTATERPLVKGWLEVFTKANELDVLPLGDEAFDLLGFVGEAIEMLFERRFTPDTDRKQLANAVRTYHRLYRRQLELELKC